MIWIVLQYLAMTLFVCGSALISTRYVYDTYSVYSVHLAWAFVLAVLGIEITKPLSVRAALGHLGVKAILPGIIGVVACVSASSYFELQVVARGREAYAVQEGMTREARAELSSRRAELTRQIESLGAVRPVGELEPLLASSLALVTRIDCTDTRSRTSRERCGDVARLESELARSKAVEELRQRLALVDGKRELVKPTTAESRSVSAVLDRFGIRFSADQIEPLLAPIMVALLQLGAMIPAAVGGGGKSGWRGWSWRKLLPQPNARKQDSDQSSTTFNHTGCEEIDDDHKRVLVVLRGRNGRIEGGERRLVEAFGMRTRHNLRLALDHLASTGRVVVTKGSKGTIVELAGRKE